MCQISCCFDYKKTLEKIMAKICECKSVILLHEQQINMKHLSISNASKYSMRKHTSNGVKHN